MSIHVDPNSFELTDQDRHSSLWARLEAFFTARLDQQRRINDNDTTPEKTAATRGRIAELKTLIAIGELPPKE